MNQKREARRSYMTQATHQGISIPDVRHYNYTPPYPLCDNLHVLRTWDKEGRSGWEGGMHKATVAIDNITPMVYNWMPVSPFKPDGDLATGCPHDIRPRT